MESKRKELIQRVLEIKHEETLDELIDMIDESERFFQRRKKWLKDHAQEKNNDNVVIQIIQDTSHIPKPPYTITCWDFENMPKYIRR